VAGDATVYRFEFEDVTGQQPSRPSQSASASPPPVSAPGAQPSARTAGNSDDSPAAKGTAGKIASGGKAAGNEATVGEGVRKVIQELGNFPVIGGAARTGLDIFDKLKPLFAEMKATGKAAATAEPPKPAIPRPTLADKGFEYDPVSQKIRPASLAAQDARAQASLPSLAKQGYEYDPVSRQIIKPATNAASNALADSAQAANAAKATNAAGSALANTAQSANGARGAATQAATGAAARAAGGAAASGAAAGGAGAATGAAGGLAAALGPIGIAAGAAAIALTLCVKAATAFAQAVTKRAAELSEFSAAGARARARNEVADVRANLRAGRDFGQNFSRVEATTGEMRRSVQRITDIFENKLLEKLLPFMESMAALVTAIAAKQGAIEAGIDGAVTAFKAGNPQLDAMLSLLGFIGGNTKQTSESLAKQAMENGDIMAFFEKDPFLTISDLLKQGAPDMVPGTRPPLVLPGVGGFGPRI
jgi:hypothetical protein